MRLRYKFCTAFVLFFKIYSYSQDSLYINNVLGFFDLTGGVDSRLNVAYRNSDTSYTSSYNGVFFRMQTSFWGSYYKQKFKKFVWGDLISGELSAGYSHAQLPSLPTNMMAMYNFEFGIFGIYRLSKFTDIGMSFALLKFSKDYASDFDSGSNYYLRLRHKRLLTEIGYISRNKLYFGVFNFISKGENIDKLSIGVKYMLNNNRIIGSRIELMPITTPLYINENQETVYSIKIFYGIHF